MSKLSKDVRDKITHILAENSAESYRDYRCRDFYELAISGAKGLSESTDQELLDEFRDTFEYVFEDLRDTTHEVDPQIKALRQLQNLYTNDQVQHAEIQTYIDLRIHNLGGNEMIVSKPDSQTLELYSLFNQAKKEMGL